MLIRLFKLSIILLSFNYLLGQNRPTDRVFSSRSEIIAQYGMAATSHPLATQTAIEILRSGGNAIDAAIAANAILGLMEPTGCGIGGDLFAIVWDSNTKKLYGLNASGRSPKSLTLDYFKMNKLKKIPSLGAIPVTVPGCIDGWFELHSRFGSLDFQDILQPAINYGYGGFPVTEIIANYFEEDRKDLGHFPGFKETYMPNGKVPSIGEIFSNPYLAKTYERIAENGREIFYNGSIAKTIVEFLAKQGGFLSMDDFSNHKSEWIQPVTSNYRGYDVWELPPNGQGIAALQILNILENYDIQKLGFGSVDYIHTFVEAKKLAYEDRAKYYSDMDFNNIPVEELISKSYAKKRKKLINPNLAGQSFPSGVLKDGDTIYLTVADSKGNIISLIQSNYRGMGSGMIPPKLGFVLQNRGELFSLKENHLNVYEPEKRPFHTIIPAFVTKDDTPFMSFGVMGGAMQPQGHVQIIVNMIDFGMNLQEAGDAPRIRHYGSSQPTDEVMKDGGVINLEFGFSEKTINKLKLMGHKVKIGTGGFGGYQAIKWDSKNKVYYGASEYRKDGQAAGY